MDAGIGAKATVLDCIGIALELSSQEFFFQRIAVDRDGCIADILKFLFLGLADHKSLIYRHIAIDHRW